MSRFLSEYVSNMGLKEIKIVYVFFQLGHIFDTKRSLWSFEATSMSISNEFKEVWGLCWFVSQRGQYKTRKKTKPFQAGFCETECMSFN